MGKGRRRRRAALLTQALARRLTAALADLTDEGALYRVDLRLRPEGRAGRWPTPSPRAFGGLLPRRGPSTWERLALLKARPVAGDGALGLRFLKEPRPFVFGRPFGEARLARGPGREAPTRPEDRGAGGDGPPREAGLRRDPGDRVVVQALQLRHAQRRPGLRERGTLAALRALHEAGLLPERSYRDLEPAYVFLRDVENKLQMVADTADPHPARGAGGVPRLRPAPGIRGRAPPRGGPAPPRLPPPHDRRCESRVPPGLRGGAASTSASLHTPTPPVRRCVASRRRPRGAFWRSSSRVSSPLLPPREPRRERPEERRRRGAAAAWTTRRTACGRTSPTAPPPARTTRSRRLGATPPSCASEALRRAKAAAERAAIGRVAVRALAMSVSLESAFLKEQRVSSIAQPRRLFDEYLESSSEQDFTRRIGAPDPARAGVLPALPALALRPGRARLAGLDLRRRPPLRYPVAPR